MQGESMRKIDTEAYNKRLHTEIMELDKMIKSINPENINQFDAGLIASATDYIGLISDATWDDRSNFNGIEMHKVKDMLNHLKINKSDYYVDVVTAKFIRRKTGEEDVDYAVTIYVPSGFDGRKSIVLTRGIMGTWLLTSGGVLNIHKSSDKINIIGELKLPESDNGSYNTTFLYVLWK
jgi:hypothetical protein